MPQTGPRRQNVAVRMRDEELALLRARSTAKGHSISDLLRSWSGLPLDDRLLARLSDRELQRHIDAHREPAASGSLPDVLWVIAVHRILETRYPATPAEFLDLYAARRAGSEAWLRDGSFRTVEVIPGLLIEIDFGGHRGDAQAGVRLAPRVPSQQRALPSATIRGDLLPPTDRMAMLLDDVTSRARALVESDQTGGAAAPT